jgi:type IV pilus assembly protein PilY1
MKSASNFRNTVTRFLGRLLSVGLLVCGLGAVYTTAEASVPVDQQPLIIQPSLSPNIVLMLDDSGSMAWDYMPDACYLNGVSCTSDYGMINSYNNAALIDPNNNGVYYNPTVTYLAPPYADSTTTTPDLYPDQTDITNVPLDGFNASSSGSVDLTNYSSNDVTGEYNNQNNTLSYSATVTYTLTMSQTVTSSSACQTLYANTSGTSGNYKSSYYTSTTKLCSFPYSQSSSAFQYALDSNSGAGPYTTYYVVHATSGGSSTCGSNCVLDTDTSGKAAPSGVQAGKNIANWFAYYHTRILMARSGLMSAFVTVSPTFRIGFGSIDGNNNSQLPSPTVTKNSQKIAEVEPFGDGTASTQKAALWTWLKGINPNNGTPLRMALDAVGKYYQTDQPWQNSDTDNTKYACRLSYTILTTDGFWNESTSSFNGPGNADGTSANTAITGPNGQSYQYAAKAPYSDSYSNTLADVAMKYWQTDLQGGTGGLLNEVPTSTADPAFWQHMTTFTLGLGFTPKNISPSGTTIDQIFNWANGGAAISGFSWPQPGSNSINNIADLAHAGLNGHGGFYSATSPQAFTSGINDALNRASERVGTGASLAANSTQLQTGTVAYQANYYTAVWSGDLTAYSVNPTTGAISTTSSWTASAALPAAASRNIWTYNPSGTTAATKYIAFQNVSGAPPALSTAQLNALGSSATAQASMINYLRGDPSGEQKNKGPYRSRKTPLGDIVNSQPVYVGTPSPNQFYQQTFTGSDTFSTYASTGTAFTRAGTIWVAANDGMLHAFDAGTGAETYAYVPGAVITDGLTSSGGAGSYPLSLLSNPLYGQSGIPHEFFNDGELTVADAYINNAWSTVLVGTTGRGPAQAVYALDVTNPASVKFLWERSATDGQTNSNYIGQLVGKPVIAQTADGQWSVLMGNGYNSTADTAALLQFDLATGSLSVHQTDNKGSNGLAAPAVWMNDLTKGVSTVAYAGDLYGRVWSFTLNTGSTSATATPSSAGSVLFTATDSSLNAQPITAGMLVGEDPLTSNVWVFFGTGQYLSSSDLTTTNVETWYGIIVQNNSGASLPALSGGRSTALVQRSIVAEQAANTSVSPPVLAARVITPLASATSIANASGWYIDLVSPNSTTPQGERMVTPNQFQGNLLIGTTRIPSASDICTPSGSGWIMAISPFTGTNPVSNFFDINGDGTINASDTVTYNGQQYAAAGVGFTSLPNNPIFAGGAMMVSFDNGSNSSVMTSTTTGGIKRVSWREMVTQ